MSFKIDSGLFKFDFTDHHAILGVPVDADFKDIRKRYLQIARRLHPDSCNAQSEADKQSANQLLSKLVNPAYEKFSKDSSRVEYIVLLKQMGKRFAQESATIELKNELSKQLAQTNSIEDTYKQLLGQLAQKQYDSFDRVLQVTAQISELNLVYLMRKAGNVQLSPPPVSIATNPSGKNAVPQSSPPATPKEPQTIVEQYLRRAQALMEKQNFASARVELQDALKLEPNNSRCHSLMGVIYLKQNQAPMAKVHINKALQLNPREQMALKAKQLLDQVTQKAGGQQATPPKTIPSKPTQGQPIDKSGGSGLFGGLFGGKKK